MPPTTTKENILDYLLQNNYNPRPHMTPKTLAMYRQSERIFTKNPMKFIKFLKHNYGIQTGEQIAEMFYDMVAEQTPPTPLLPTPADPDPDPDYSQYMSRFKERIIEENQRLAAEAYGHTDPAGKAEQVLEEDSEKWASEFITAPTDTPMDKAEELREQWLKNKPPKIPPEKMMGVGPQVREAMRKAMDEEGYISEDELSPKERQELKERRELGEGHLVLQCQECEATFDTRGGLANHRRAHARDREREQKRQKRQRGRPKKQ
jgi:hypothetical protein